MNRAKNVCLFLVFLMAVSAPALWPEETALFRINRLSPKVLILTEISPMENMIVALASQKGLVVVDTTGSPQTAGLARQVIAREFGRNDFAWVIDTHYHWDHTFGTAAFEDVPVIIQENGLAGIQQDEAGLAEYLAGLERAVADLSSQISQAAPQSEARQALELRRAFFARNLEGMKGRDRLVRPAITFSDRLTLRLGDLTVNLIFFGRAHSGSDIFVHVPEEGLLLTGDLFLERGWLPFFAGQIDLDIPRWIEVLDGILAPASNVRCVVPGHRDVWKKEKLALFQMNVELFPASANVYDSLAEAFMLNGDRDQAIANYRRSLELNPNNQNAKDMLQKLQDKTDFQKNTAGG